MQNDIVQFTHLGLLKIAGDGAKKLLQGQLTCHLDELSPTNSLLGAHCNPQGRIISLFRLFQLNDAYYLQMPRSLVPIAMAALKKYAVFFKVTLTDASDEFATVTPPDNWHYSNIINKIPAIYPETTELFLPHELNLPELGAVSFTKGCYTGQEIIARMHYRGKTKNLLTAAEVKTNQTPKLGADIYHETGVAGTIVDVCEIAQHTFALLMTIKPCEHLFLDAKRQITIRLL